MPKNEEGKSKFRDFLIWYNNLDVRPFVDAINAHRQAERHDKIDLLKDGISLPSLTMKYLMSRLNMSEGDFFTTFGEQHKDVVQKIERGIRGGASIVFRY